MAYVDPFGGSTISPVDISYSALTISANTALEWPSLVSTGSMTARIMEVTASVGSLSLAMPNATQTAPGQSVLFTNVGANTFTLTDAGNNTLATIASGESKYVYLETNATTNGTWRVIAFGVGTSTVSAASLVGYGIKAISASLNQSHPVTNTSISVTIASTDRARLYTDDTGVTFSLPAAGTIGDDFFFLVRNIGSGTTTIDPDGAELIDGASTITLAATESCLVCCNGTAWYTVGRGRSTTFAYSQLVKNVAGNSNVTLTSTESGYKILKFTGLLTGNINVIVTNAVTVWYIDNAATGAYTITVKTAAGTGITVAVGARVILYCDGTNVLDAQTVFTASGLFDGGSAAAPGIAFTSDPDTGLYSAGANQLGISAGGAQVALLTSTGLNNTVIGATAPTTATFTTMTATSTNATQATMATANITNAVLTNPLPAIYGGTGKSSYTTGDLLVATSSTTVSVITAATSGYVLTAQGVGTVPAFVAPSAASIPGYVFTTQLPQLTTIM